MRSIQKLFDSFDSFSRISLTTIKEIIMNKNHHSHNDTPQAYKNCDMKTKKIATKQKLCHTLKATDNVWAEISYDHKVYETCNIYTYARTPVRRSEKRVSTNYVE